MDYRIKITMKAIIALIAIAVTTIAVRSYWFDHSIMQRWGSTLVIVNMFLNMAVIVVAMIATNRHKQTSKR